MNFARGLSKLPRLARGFADGGVHLFVFVTAIVCAFLLRFDFAVPPSVVGHLLLASFILPVVKLLVFVSMGLHRNWWRYVSVHEIGALGAGNALGSLVGAGVIFLAGPAGFPRSVYLLDFILCYGLSSGIRLGARLLADRQRSKTHRQISRAALIYGAGDAGVMLAREIRQNASLQYSLCGFIDDDTKKGGARIQGLKVLGRGDDLGKIIERTKAEMIFIAVPSASGTEMTNILTRCSGNNVAYKTIPPMGEIIEGNGLLPQIRDVAVEDLLGRKPVRLDLGQIREKLAGKVVMVSGAGGSIGSELCRQIARFEPALLIGFEIAETQLFYLEREMRETAPNIRFVAEIGSVQNTRRLREVFALHRPDTVFHAAAYKHVPMMEAHIFEAIENNIFGTREVARCSAEFGARDFVMISTDKAVRPTNIMGATKRIAELVVRSMQNRGTNFVSVRFGNVLGSNGSVIPIFKEQIAAGGPVTVTHPEMTRYFMTIPEAAQLVLQASSIGNGGEIFVLDMGEPVKISDLARDLILLSGLRPYQDIDIQYSGMRPGEKLYEELHLQEEDSVATGHEKIKAYLGQTMSPAEVDGLIESLEEICSARDIGRLVLTLKRIVPDYNPSPELLERAARGRPWIDTQVGLRKAKRPEDAWELVKAKATELGFHGISLRIGSNEWRTQSGEGFPGAELIAELPLRNGDFVRLCRPFTMSADESTIRAFLEVLSEELIDVSGRWKVKEIRTAAGA